MEYFQPKIEDIRVGYCCEYYDEADYMDWIKKTINYDTLQRYNWEFIIKRGELRVPYLTTGQIINEGWILQEEIEDNKLNNTKNFIITREDGSNYYLKVWFNHYSIYVKRDYLGEIERGTFTIFNGNCPSINELKYFSRFLGITSS